MRRYMPLADPGVYNSWTLQPASRCPTRLTTLSPLPRSLPRCLHRPPTPLCLLRFAQHGLLCLQGQLCLHRGPLCLHRGPLRLPSLVAPPPSFGSSGLLYLHRGSLFLHRGSTRLHRRLIKTFGFFFASDNDHLTSISVPFFLPEPPTLVAIVALRPLATTLLRLSE